jgi:transcription initiation factor TFIID subunit 6
LPAESRTSMATVSGSTSAEVEVKPLVKHALSKELQLYFERVVAVLTEDSSNATMKNAVLNSLGNDPGLHQLIPYFIQFVAEKIRLNLKDASMLYLMLQVLHRLLTNPTIFIEPYVCLVH